VDVSSSLNESVPVGFTDYCRDLVLYANSIDDIKDDDIDKVKKEDYINFLLPATNRGIHPYFFEFFLVFCHYNSEPVFKKISSFFVVPFSILSCSSNCSLMTRPQHIVKA
jgi:hypothetical protein